jgi:[ribosomal protein S18]-alanine N-acetyltransferase
MYLLRDFRPSDFETLYRIDQECFDLELAYSRAELNQYLLRKGAFAVVAEDKKGSIGGFVAAETSRGFGHIITIDVLPGARRSGLGTHLMMEAEQRMRAAGAKAVMLETAVDNLTALRFYKRLKYSVEKVIPRYYNGNRDALLLSKGL